jgi:predicted small lipoprotein YifL
MKSIFPFPRSIVRLVVAIIMLGSLSACGNKGPLVPPKAIAIAGAHA